ncbi:hypothetical protein [Nocardia sp. NPDC060255]|uniref:hypothetical protein n=1 Tax=Nocardia sp. NPDC060255 TaxID=3347085 RepID=UPI003648C089
MRADAAVRLNPTTIDGKPLSSRCARIRIARTKLPAIAYAAGENRRADAAVRLDPTTIDGKPLSSRCARIHIARTEFTGNYVRGGQKQARKRRRTPRLRDYQWRAAQLALRTYSHRAHQIASKFVRGGQKRARGRRRARRLRDYRRQAARLAMRTYPHRAHQIASNYVRGGRKQARGRRLTPRPHDCRRQSRSARAVHVFASRAPNLPAIVCSAGDYVRGGSG